MDDDLQSLQEKLHHVSCALNDFSANREQAIALCDDIRQLLSALESRTHVEEA